MKTHAWTTEEVDGGHVGVCDFWICLECGASGGPTCGVRHEKQLNGDVLLIPYETKPPTMPPFFADGSGMLVGDDCEAAKSLIERKRCGQLSRSEYRTTLESVIPRSSQA